MAKWTRRAVLGGAGLVTIGAAGLYLDRSSAARAYDDKVRTVWQPPADAPGDDRARALALVHAATLAANGHNTQPWIFHLGEPGRIRILPDLTRRTAVVDPDDHHLYASLGAAAENLAIAADHFGLVASVTGSAEGVDVVLARSGAARPATPLFQALTARRCVRLDYDGRPLSATDWDALAAAGRSHGVAVDIRTALVDLDRLADLVIAGNTAQMDDPAFVAELLAWIRFDGRQAAETLDGLYAAASGNPTVPPWLGRRIFPLAFNREAENAKYRGHVRSSAGLAILIAQRDDPQGWIAAGRASQRMALEAAARGIRTAFLNQPTEALSVRPMLMSFLGTNRRPNLVMRFGTGPETLRSLRRTPEGVGRGA